MNANVELSLVSLPTPNSGGELTFTPVITHIFFPSRKELTEYFYSSEHARSNPSEYKKRLMCGEHQLALCFFSEEVLGRYFSHLDWYEVDDSSAGGHIWTKSSSPDERYIDVRFGKGKSEDGKTFVTAIYKDLYALSDAEQRHWHAHEIARPTLDPSDENFKLFAARTYDGAWVEFPKPIQKLQGAIIRLNTIFSPDELFGRVDNEHLRMPVENTNKALADSCSELYKIVGPDSLKANPIKTLLQSALGKHEPDFIHASTRPLSALQLLELAEVELKLSIRLSVAIKAVAKHRVDADHKILTTSSSDANYGDEFISLCNQVTQSANAFAEAVESMKLDSDGIKQN
ncbi:MULTISPECIES: hypothetical protein [unclassified Pseudomonas]|uniref:hypothetical protein n=1 Tax=unclassified Pseudomonas TaxID=196821 RepID=UPI0011AFB383|nr:MULTISPECIES: hypothetical protein [unclassified Pseudomonas]